MGRTRSGAHAHSSSDGSAPDTCPPPPTSSSICPVEAQMASGAAACKPAALGRREVQQVPCAQPDQRGQAGRRAHRASATPARCAAQIARRARSELARTGRTVKGHRKTSVDRHRRLSVGVYLLASVGIYLPAQRWGLSVINSEEDFVITASITSQSVANRAYRGGRLTRGLRRTSRVVRDWPNT